MVLTTMNCTLIFITLCIQLILIQSEINNTKHDDNPLIKQNEEPEEQIRLQRFIRAIPYIFKECTDMGRSFNYEHNSMYPITRWFIYDDVKERRCNKDMWILNWEKDDLGQNDGIVNCAPAPPKCGDNYECVPCLCVSPNTEPFLDIHDSIRSVSLHSQETDFEKNMIVTGLRFRHEKFLIHLQIQQAKLLENGDVDENKFWIELEDFVKLSNASYSVNFFVLKAGKDYSSFSYDTRTIFLDQIFVPDEYVVTGLRLVEIDSSEGHKGVKMQVKGTKFDSTHRLISNTDRWFDYSDNVAQDISYNRRRTEITLNNCTDSALTTDNTEIVDTNRFIRFRGTDMKKDRSNHVIPYFSSKTAESTDKRPVRGVGLSYKGREGYGGYITVKVFHDKSSMFNSKLIIITGPIVGKTTVSAASSVSKIIPVVGANPVSETPVYVWNKISKGAQKGLAAKFHCQIFVIAISSILFILL